jgi:hypothetical protein
MDARNKITYLGNYRVPGSTTQPKPDQNKTETPPPSGLGAIILKEPRKIGTARSQAPHPNLVKSKRAKPALERRNGLVNVRPNPHDLAKIPQLTIEPLNGNEFHEIKLDQSASIEDSSESQGTQQPKGPQSKLSNLIPKILKREKKPPSAAERMFNEVLKQVKNKSESDSSDDEMNLQIRAHRGNAPVVCKDIEAANANAFAAFGMSAHEVFRELRMSDVYDDASTKDKDHLGYMLPRTLEGFLWQLLDETDARTTISQCKLTPTEAVAIRFYGLQGFTNVQPSLRKEDGAAPLKDCFQNLVDACCSGLSKLPPLAEETTLFRGTSHFPDGQPGQTYEDPAFTSTTLRKEIAEVKFGGNQSEFFLLQIAASPTSPCRDISKLTGNEEEREYLFPPKTRFEIDSMTQRGELGSTLVKLRPL